MTLKSCLLHSVNKNNCLLLLLVLTLRSLILYLKNKLTSRAKFLPEASPSCFIALDQYFNCIILVRTYCKCSSFPSRSYLTSPLPITPPLSRTAPSFRPDASESLQNSVVGYLSIVRKLHVGSTQLSSSLFTTGPRRDVPSDYHHYYRQSIGLRFCRTCCCTTIYLLERVTD